MPVNRNALLRYKTIYMNTRASVRVSAAVLYNSTSRPCVAIVSDITPL